MSGGINKVYVFYVHKKISYVPNGPPLYLELGLDSLPWLGDLHTTGSSLVC